MESCKIHFDGAKISYVEIDGVDKTREVCIGAEDIFFYFHACESPILETNFNAKRSLYQRIRRRLYGWRK